MIRTRTMLPSLLVAALVLCAAGTASASKLMVKNQSSDVICYVYASPCASNDWGSDRLGDEVLGSGDMLRIELARGCWDLRAEDCDENPVAERRGFNLSGDTSWTISGGRAAETATVTVRNRTDGVVCYVYVSPCSANHWGDDILEEDVLGTGQSARVRVQHGCWDFKAEDCDHNVLASRTGVTVAGDTTWTLEGGGGASARLTVRNRSDEIVCYLYASPCAADDWGSDRLGDEVIGVGDSFRLNLTQGCWDLRAEDCDEDEIDEQRGFTLTTGSTWTVD